MLPTAAGPAAQNAGSLQREISGALVTPQKGPARGEGPSPSLTAVITSLRVSSDPVAHLKYVRLLFKK